MKIKHHFIIAAFLAVAMLGFGSAASAQTTDIEAMIAQLKAKIQELTLQLNQLLAQQASQTGSESGSQAWCHTFNQNLGFAQSGTGEVGYLHTALEKEGISCAPDTGNAYGLGTLNGVAAFQEKYASEILPPNFPKSSEGYFGSSTRTKLNQLYGCVQGAPVSASGSQQAAAPAPAPQAQVSSEPAPFVPQSLIVHITNCRELQNLNNIESNGINTPHYKFVLDNDIDCSETKTWNNGAGFWPIGRIGVYCSHQFKSCYDLSNSIFSYFEFDGQSHAIKNLFINSERSTDLTYSASSNPKYKPSSSDAYGLTFRGLTFGGDVGLFGAGLKEIKNLRLENVDITGNIYVGALYGNLSGSNARIYNVGVTGTVRGKGYYAGGIVALMSGQIENSYFKGSVIGAGSCPFYGCYDTGNIWINNEPYYRKVGGLVGGGGQIKNSYAEADVMAPAYKFVGGLAGVEANVENSYFVGNVKGELMVGGITGENIGRIDESYSEGTVEAVKEMAGGIAGRNIPITEDGRGLVVEDGAYITNSFSKAEVRGPQYVGGLVGMNTSGNMLFYPQYHFEPKTLIENSYSVGKVVDTSGNAGSSAVGGLVGISEYKARVENSYWDIQTSEKSYSVAGIGKTTAEMKQAATFSDWDFNNIWSIQEGVSYPYLKSRGITCGGTQTKSCSEMGFQCGLYKDQCDNILDCGSCGTGNRCDTSANKCVADVQKMLIAHFKLSSGENYTDLLGNSGNTHSFDINKAGFTIAVLADGNFYAAKGYSLSWDSNASAAARRYNYWFGKEDGKIKLQYAGLVNGSMAYEYKKSANQVPAGKHWFVGVMSSKSDIKLYVDGTEYLGSYIPDPFLGAPDNPAPVDGNLSVLGQEIKIWNYALSEQEIKSNYVVAPQIVCANECSYEGKLQCSDSAHKQTCGDYDADGCLEWSAAELCTGDTSCGYGVCYDDQKPRWYCSGDSCGYECVVDSSCQPAAPTTPPETSTPPPTTTTTTPTIPVCVPAWACTQWTSCVTGVQTRTCTDSNNCGVATDKPVESQTCVSLTPGCTDTDNGKNYYTKGSVTSIVYGMTFGPYIDFCSGSSLREYYCDTTTGNYSSELYVCPNGCQDSVCQQAPAVPTASINPLTPITPTVYSIAVASPNGGEIWQAGTTHDITWTASGVTNVYITLATYNSSGSRVGLYSVAPGVPASLGKYTWTIPSYYSLISSYTARSKIIISSTASATSATVSDQSDNYFSIVVPTAYEANATDPLAAVSQALQDILEQIRLLLAK